jgi:Sulfatase
VPLRAPDPPGSFLRAGLHLAALSAFAIAQPLFDLLSRNAEFFAVRGSARSDIVAFALGVLLVPPLLLLALVALAGLADRSAATGLHLLFVGGLAALFVLQAIHAVDASAALLLTAATAGGALAALLYVRARPARMLLTVLGAAPALFLGLFLLGSPVERILFAPTPEPRLASVSARAPVVMIVLDELPTVSLMNRRGELDAVRYPNFARLAADATWYRNATTVHEWTSDAVPAMLTGRLPGDELPIYVDHPDNLFTLLGGSYRLRVFESQTHLCPDELCAEEREPFVERVGSLLSDLSVVYGHLALPDDLAARLPSISSAWRNFAGEPSVRLQSGPAVAGGRLAAYDERDLEVGAFVQSLGRAQRPTLAFLHVLLPHHPWEYLPDGRRYAVNLPTQPGMVNERWEGDPYFALQAHQRHLLQVGYVDTALGRILDRLEATGAYDDALVVVVADHGVSFRPHGERRRVHAGNLEEIAFVPLLVKAPGQRTGRVEDAHVRTVDLLPTIAELLGVRVPWETDGSSAVRVSPDDHPQVVVHTSSGERVSGDAEELAERRDRVLESQVRLFGDGEEPPGLYAVGPHLELLGEEVNGLAAGSSGGPSYDLYGDTWYDPEAPVLPTRIAGEIEGVPGDEDVAIAVNGRIAAVTRTFSFSGDTLVSALLPERAFRPGANQVRLFVVSEEDGDLRLEELPRDEG